jgi:hypothetical protein
MTRGHDTELVIVTGKGGTGRTTVATALGLAAAARGRRTIVCAVGGQAEAAGLLAPGAPASRAGEERPVGDGLWSTTIDPDRALEEWAARQLPRRLVGPLLRAGVFKDFLGAAPGARELLTITKAWELGQERRWRRDARGYDTVVLDAPASGHGLGMLRTPRTFAEIARIGPIAGQARTVADALADPGASRLVAVALPTELPVNETLELEGQVASALGRPLDAIVVNGVWPRRMSAADAATVAAADGAVDPGVRRAVASTATRVRGQQAQLARLRREAVARIQTLPFVFAGGLDREQLGAFSARLGRDD